MTKARVEVESCQMLEDSTVLVSLGAILFWGLTFWFGFWFQFWFYSSMDKASRCYTLLKQSSTRSDTDSFCPMLISFLGNQGINVEHKTIVVPVPVSYALLPSGDGRIPVP